MKGPLSPDVYDTSRWPDSWWRHSAPAWQGPAPLSDDTDTDVAIIGGGYAGLACAQRLAERGVGALVLDAGEIGWGASGRNGGLVGITTHKLTESAVIARHGEAEVARYAAVMRAGVDRIASFCAAEGLADILQGRGKIVYAHSSRSLRELRAKVPPIGTEIEPVEPSGRTGLARFGGIRMSPFMSVHPLRLVRALCDKAVRSGVRVYPLSEVTDWQAQDGRHLLITPQGSVRAERVVIATNGFTPDGLHPGMHGRAFPVISNIAVTRVLTPDERARHPWMGEDAVVDTRNLLVYLRMLPEGRLLFGMRGDLTGADASTEATKVKVRRRLAQCFPGWADVEIDYFWRGPICATTSFTPSIGQLSEDPTVYHAFGWHGSGVNGAQVGGRLLADVLAGASMDSIPAPFRGAAKRIPFAGLRPFYVWLSMWQQRIEDAFG